MYRGDSLNLFGYVPTLMTFVGGVLRILNFIEKRVFWILNSLNKQTEYLDNSYTQKNKEDEIQYAFYFLRIKLKTIFTCFMTPGFQLIYLEAEMLKKDQFQVKEIFKK